MYRAAVLCLLTWIGTGSVAASGQYVSIVVDAAKTTNVMRGGIGASWHAIEEPIPYSDKPHPIFANMSHGGSGWGAYPPAEDDAAWRQIDRHARWLGFDWNRVESSSGSTSPSAAASVGTTRKCGFSTVFSTGAKRTRPTCFCSRCGEMSRWNTFPEWRDDPIGRVHSGPVSMEDFGEGLATLVEHLVKRRATRASAGCASPTSLTPLVVVAEAAEPTHAAKAGAGRGP